MHLLSIWGVHSLFYDNIISIWLTMRIINNFPKSGTNLYLLDIQCCHLYGDLWQRGEYDTVLFQVWISNLYQQSEMMETVTGDKSGGQSSTWIYMEVYYGPDLFGNIPQRLIKNTFARCHLHINLIQFITFALFSQNSIFCLGYIKRN